MEPGRQEEVEEDSGRFALGRSTLLLAALQQLPPITSGALGSGAEPAPLERNIRSRTHA